MLVAAFDVHPAADGSPSTLWIGISGDATNACDPVCAGDQNSVEISIPATTPTSGTFSLTGDQDDVASAYVNSTCPTGNGEDLSVFMGEPGSVTLDVKSATQIEGSFSIAFASAFLGTGDGGRLGGTFVATPCPD